MDDLFSEKVEAMRVWPGMTVNDLILQMKASGAFSAGAVAKAVDVYERMVREGAFIVLCLAGALTPAGMGRIVTTLIERGLVHGIVSTGANLVHDVTEALGGHFYKASPLPSDEELYRRGIDRIYDVIITEKDFQARFDEPILKIYSNIARDRKNDLMSINEFLMEVASRLPDVDCILKACYKHGVKLFVPEISDSVYGLMAALFNRRSNTPLCVDTFKDLQEMWDIREKHERCGAIVLGGGVPKNYVFQSFYFTKKRLDYVIQITLDRPETGGLSGAPPQEAVSWGKVKAEAGKVVVVSEVTLAFPLIVASLLERLEGK